MKVSFQKFLSTQQSLELVVLIQTDALDESLKVTSNN